MVGKYDKRGPLYKYVLGLRNANVLGSSTKKETEIGLHFGTALPLDGGRGSSVGIATRYGLDGPAIESRWGRDFPHPSRPVMGPTQSPVQ